MALIYPCLLIYFLSSEKRRDLLNRTHFYLSLVLLLVIISPLIIWTVEHDFINFLHVFHQGKNQSTSSIISLKYFLEFLGGQAGVVSPLIFVIVLWASIKALRTSENHKWKEYYVMLSCFGFPVFIVFLIMSLKMRIHPNWPAVSYFAMLILSAGVSLDTYERLSQGGKKSFRKLIYTAAGLAALILILAYNTDGLRWLGIKFLPEKVDMDQSSLNRPVNKTLRFFHDPKKDPANRLKGWRELGKYIDKVMLEMDENNTFIFSSQYQVAGEVAFYTKKQYRTYCINFGRRINQYDVWGGWDRLTGMDAIQVEDTKTQLNDKVRIAFKRCELHSYFEAKRFGRVIKDWTIFKCYNFTGLEEEDAINSY